VVKQTIEFGEYVAAADRLEVLKPPYKVVTQQEATPRGKLKIIGARFQDSQTLVLSTDPQPQPLTYALTIRDVKKHGDSGPGATVDLDYDLRSSFSQADRLSLVAGLPHGGQIAASIRESHLSIADSHPKIYPFIHSNLEEQDKTMDLSGGDFERGRGLFFGEQIKCSTCHRIRGEGATVGPDLSNLSSRDAASVLRDVKEPSASINPDYVAYNVSLKSGVDLSGFVRAQDEKSLRLVGPDGKESWFSRSDVKELRPSAVSLMPAGLLDSLKEGQVRDLLTFLLSAPPMRSGHELSAALASSKSGTESHATTPLELVLVASKQDHGPAQHDYPAWQTNWHRLLAQAPGVHVADAWLWPSADQFQRAQVILFYYWNHEWNDDKYQQLDDFLAHGGGIVLLHAATIGDPDPLKLAQRFGLAADSGKTKYLHTPLELQFVAPTNNPITMGLPNQLHFLDEPYWPMFRDTNQVEVLATTRQEGADWPMVWTCQKGKGRVFASIIGHYTWTLDDPWFRLILMRGIAWAANGEVNRLEKLAVIAPELN
jgi:putative heme-binding domain-containing protein